MTPDLVVVGCGFFGATIAERAACGLGLKVLVLERRSHIGGNAFSEIDAETGIEVHRYGPHLFHTSNMAVWDYLRRFTAFTSYRHAVFATHRGAIYPMPINLDTICRFFGRTMTPAEARALLREQAAELGGRRPANLEEKAISLVGRPLYDALIRDYTWKQWQTDPRDLPEHIINRLPLRFIFENRYFDDTHEGLPADGYTKMFGRMLDHPGIEVRLGADYLEMRGALPAQIPVVYTGPIDRFFDGSAGKLRWRTVDFARKVVGTPDFQGCAVMNFSDRDVPFTRSVEYRHLHPERRYTSDRTVVVREFPREAGAGDEPFYPVGSAEDRETYARYRTMAAEVPNVIFGGRLGTYRYIDMHQAVASALKVYERDLMPYFQSGRRLPLKKKYGDM